MTNVLRISDNTIQMLAIFITALHLYMSDSSVPSPINPSCRQPRLSWLLGTESGNQFTTLVAISGLRTKTSRELSAFSSDTYGRQPSLFRHLYSLYQIRFNVLVGGISWYVVMNYLWRCYPISFRQTTPRIVLFPAGSWRPSCWDTHPHIRIKWRGKQNNIKREYENC